MAYNELEKRGTADFPLDFFHIDKNHPRYHMSAHWHSEIELIRILEGSLDIKLNNNEYHAKKDDVIFINSETVHQAVPHECEYECIVFHINFLYNETYSCRYFIENILNREYTVTEFIPCSDDEFHRAVKGVFEALSKKSSGYKFRTIAAFYLMLGIIVDEHMYFSASGNKSITADKNLVKLKKVLLFIRSNYNRTLTLEEMAKTAKMSPKYFGTFFKNMTGKTPFEYLNEYRIEKASRKLLNSDDNITDIAFSCGFNDLSYFIKTFKRINKNSPGRYRLK